ECSIGVFQRAQCHLLTVAGRDLSHLLAIIILLLKIWTSRSCAGISGKSQMMFALTYTTRYLDLFTNYISLYNSTMKVIFLAASYATLYLIYLRFKATYDHNHDTFRVEFLLIPTVIFSLLINHDYSPLEILWTFSIYLEAVAILPQLFMVSKTGEAESITSHYLFALGSYRALYIFNWVYRYYAEGFYDLIAIVAGVFSKERSSSYQPKAAVEVFLVLSDTLNAEAASTALHNPLF
ncbi:ER lumen protein-retaining receptor 1-like, partial [Homarus americanus]